MLQRQDVVHQRYQLQQKLNQNASRQTWLAIDLSAQPSQPGFSFSLCPNRLGDCYIYPAIPTYQNGQLACAPGTSDVLRNY